MALIAKYSLNGNANDLVWSNHWTESNVTWVDWKNWIWVQFSWVSTSNILLPTSFYDLIKWRNDYWFDFWLYPTSAVNSIVYSYSYWADFYFYFSSVWKVMIRRWTNYTIESWTSIEFNKWQKCTLNYTSWTNVDLYKNWVFVQWFTISATPNISSIFYLWRYFDTTFPFTGKIDRFQVWIWILNATEIKNDYLLTSWYY